jgi:hypothetical protein
MTALGLLGTLGGCAHLPNCAIFNEPGKEPSMNVRRMSNLSAFALACLPCLAHASPVVESTNFIGNAYVHFNGFEGAQAQSSGPYSGDSYTEDGIRVTQQYAPNFGKSIRTDSVAGGFEGSKSWGPPFGDFGWTDITKSDGSDFVDVGFLIGSAYGSAVSGGINSRASVFVYYELWNNGAVVFSDTLSGQGVDAHWLGFSGGGFDEIKLRDGADFVNKLDMSGNGFANGLFIDSIKTAGDRSGAGNQVPEPGSLALAGLAFGLCMGALRRRC